MIMTMMGVIIVIIMFDNLGVKNDQKDIWDSYMVEEGQKIRARPSPPLFGQCTKENVSFYKTGVELRFWPVQARILTKVRKRLSRQNLTKKCVNSKKFDKKVCISQRIQNFNKSA